MPIWCNQRISLDCTGEAAGSLTPVAPRNSIESWPELDARNLYDSTATQASQAMAPPWACRSQQSILQSPKTQHSQHSQHSQALPPRCVLPSSSTHHMSHHPQHPGSPWAGLKANTILCFTHGQAAKLGPWPAALPRGTQTRIV